MTKQQIDLFANGSVAAPVPQKPDPEQIRARLNSVLQQLRDAGSMPWKPAELRSWQHVFHNMANWLPPEERDQLRRDFKSEVTRLEHV